MKATIPDDLLVAVRHVNSRRARGDADQDEVARQLEASYGVSRQLCVYGSLAPGEVNHDVIASLGGTWRPATVHGERRRRGWGANIGFFALRWRADGPPVAAQLLVSDALPHAWPDIDEFEGPEYRRILAPIVTEAGITVANVYVDAADAD